MGEKERNQLWVLEIREDYWFDDALTGEERVRAFHTLDVISDWQVVEAPEVKVLTVKSISSGSMDWEFESRNQHEQGQEVFFLDYDNHVVVREIAGEDTEELTGQDLALSASDLTDLLQFSIRQTSGTKQTPREYLESVLELRALCDEETGRCYSLQIGVFEGPESPRNPLWVRTREGSSWHHSEKTERWLELVEEAGFGIEVVDDIQLELAQERKAPVPRFLGMKFPEPTEISVCPSVSQDLVAIYDSGLKLLATDVELFCAPADKVVRHENIPAAVQTALSWAEDHARFDTQSRFAKALRETSLMADAVEVLNIAGEGARGIPESEIDNSLLHQIGEYGSFASYETEVRWRSLAQELTRKINDVQDRAYRVTFLESPEEEDMFPRTVHFIVEPWKPSSQGHDVITWSLGNGYLDSGDPRKGEPVSSDEFEAWTLARDDFDSAWDWEKTEQMMLPWFSPGEGNYCNLPPEAKDSSVISRFLSHVVRRKTRLNPDYVLVEAL